MGLLAITVLGHDRPGIIADATSAIAELGGNILDSSMTLLRGHFAWMLITDIAAGADEVQGRLAFLSEQGLVVSVLPVPPEEHRVSGDQFMLTVHGADRPGIVAELTGVLAVHGGNITDLSTRLGSGGLYLLVVEVEIPHDVDVVSLGSALAQKAQSLGVDASLRAGDADLF